MCVEPRPVFKETELLRADAAQDPSDEGIGHTITTIASFYGSSCANHGKGALNTPSFPSPFLTLCPAPHFLPLVSPWALLTSHASPSA
eukprot:3430859-Pyramimonas_sp.AAC.2